MKLKDVMHKLITIFVLTESQNPGSASSVVGLLESKWVEKCLFTNFDERIIERIGISRLIYSRVISKGVI
ncbi:MAG: hypothetical protein IJQ68_06205 [Methanobrevibacter sp.]|uniref:hypothetical protein n=1 Tax=Methanobrevibacter sp. TaxID=66852 RepID=UPI0025D30223|nr:hypothetical protein [Methanobrevibacter sp.]MBR0271566.1 hypothetical protein [Methanobrevibacter sp.]